MAWSRLVPVGIDSSGLVTRSAKEPAAGAVSGFSDIVQKFRGYLEKELEKERWRGGRGVKKSSK